MRPPTTAVLLAVLAALAVATGTVAQDAPPPTAPAPPQPPPCATPEHRQFDFWLGAWDVQGAGGGPPGRNVISSIHGGCALREEYVNRRYEGSSVNFYDSRDGRWHQVWIDNQGGPLFLAGGLEDDGRMVMQSDGSTGRIDRVAWTPLDDGAVRQLWEASEDGGATWTTVFDGRYTKAAP